MLYGKNPQQVIDLLKARRDGGQGVDPGRKLGLIVEGGGMRGVLSAGSLLAVDHLGLRKSFDIAFGSSAGGVNVAYFLSGQGTLGITVYFDSISNLRFANPARFWRILDVEYVYDHVTTKEKPLCDQAIKDQHTKFYLSATNANTGEADYFDVNNTNETVSRLLWATGAIPVLYNRTVEVDGSKYVDGGLSDLLPIQHAIDMGCTDILVLLTKRSDYLHRPPGPMVKTLFRCMIGGRYPKVQQAYENAYKSSNKARRMAGGEGLPEHVSIATICPERDEEVVGRTTMNRDVLLGASQSLAVKTYRAFGEDPGAINQVFTALRNGSAHK